MQPNENNDPNVAQPQPNTVPESLSPTIEPVTQPAPQPEVQPVNNPFGPAPGVTQSPVQQPVDSNPVAYPPVSSSPSGGSPKKSPVKLIVIIASILAFLGLVYFVGLPLLNKAAPGIVPSGIVPNNALTANLSGLPLTEYTSPAGGFTIKVPEGWVPKEQASSGSVFVTFSEPVENTTEAEGEADTDTVTQPKGSIFIICSDTSSLTGGKKYTKEEYINLAKSSEKGEGITVKSEGDVKINGLSGYKVLSNAEVTKNGVTSKSFSVGVTLYINESKGCGISVSGEESQIKLSASADSILNSFKLK